MISCHKCERTGRVQIKRKSCLPSEVLAIQRTRRMILMITRSREYGHWADKGLISASIEYKTDLFRLGDVLGMSSGLIIAHLIRFNDLVFTPSELIVSQIFVLLFNLSASSLGLYSQSNARKLYRVASVVFVAFSISVSLLALGLLLTHTAESFSRVWFFLGSSAGLIIILAYRKLAFQAMQARWLYLKPKRVVIVGSGKLGQEVAARLGQDPYLSNEVVGYVIDEEECLVESGKVLGTCDDIEEILENFRIVEKPIDRVFIALPATDLEKKLQITNRLINTQYHVFVVPDYSLQLLTNSRSDNIIGLPVVDVSHSQLQGSRASVKYLMDVCLALIACVAFLPMFLLVAIAIKRESYGPVFFKQRRYGLGGVEFRVYKFRTMKVVEDGDDIVQAKKDDDRVTNVGKVLRKYSIDELPQLLNVLNGTMSLVGPRPHAVAHNEMYRNLIGGYMRRHAIKPGITGWAQVNGCRGETSTIGKMQKRVDFDREYLQRWSVGLDIFIIFKTVAQVVRGEDVY